MTAIRAYAQFFLASLRACVVVAIFFSFSLPAWAQADPDQKRKMELQIQRMDALLNRTRETDASDQTLRAQIAQQLGRCWNPSGYDRVPVPLRWPLRPDGGLNGEPTVDSRGTSPLFLASVDAAVRAVKACAPFKLPPDRYEVWKSIVWNFDPHGM